MADNDVLANIRTRLENERRILQSDIESLVVENEGQQDDYGVGNHLADDASELFTRERNIALRNNAQDLLAHVESALRRLDEGTYGICARCGKAIATERLDALPYAIYCITCQSEIEHQR
ncbi:MAG TPA: TraR/DksA C4-type zinc finger protein [Roseiflexaceae bacterium]